MFVSFDVSLITRYEVNSFAICEHTVTNISLLSYMIAASVQMSLEVHDRKDLDCMQCYPPPPKPVQSITAVQAEVQMLNEVNKDYCKSRVDEGWFDSVILFSCSQCWRGLRQGLDICNHFHWGQLARRLLSNFPQQTLWLGQVVHLGCLQGAQRVLNDIL